MAKISNRGPEWGNRSQLGATVKLLEDLKTGNRDGILGNEDKAAGTLGNVFERNPAVQRAKDFASVGFSTKDEIATLNAFVQAAEKEWGQPVLDPAVRDRMNGGELYGAQKAIRLQRLGRTPNEVVDGFVSARGSVDGREIAPRDLHFEKYAALGDPSGKVVVISPGFLETGRTFEEQIQKLNELGHTVIVMDHQWAGQSEGKPGGIDSGFGIARDVAAMTAFAAEEAKKDFGDAGSVMLFGNSMGGGPGAFGAALLNDAGKIKLEGAQMPKGVDLVLQAPFFGATPSLLNLGLQGGAQLPFLNRLKLPGTGLPDITDDKRAEQLGAQGMVLEDVRAQLSAFKTAQADIDDILARVSLGERPQGKIVIVGNDNDTLADSAKWTELKAELGGQLDLRIFAGSDHVVSQALGAQDRAVDAIDELTR